MKLEHIFIAGGHAFFGRFGQPQADHPAREVPRAECVAGWGLRGDRFFGHRPDYKGQVTFFSREVLDELRASLGLPHAEPAALRRNLIVRGADLNALIGREFSLQGVALFGVEECRPCHWMNGSVGPGAEDWLRGRGGLRARVLSSGWLEAADAEPVSATPHPVQARLG